MKSLKLIFITILIFSLSSTCLFSKVQIDTNKIMNHIIKLSSNNFEGRKSGLIGGVRAADYITSKLKEYGILPGGPNNSYHQIFKIDFFNVKNSKLKVITSTFSTNMFLKKDYYVLKYSGSSAYKGNVIFIGFGIESENYNELKDINIRGKLVLMLKENPRFLRYNKDLNLNKRIANLQKKGAAGVILFGNKRIKLEKELFNPNFLIIDAKKRLVDFLFYDNMKKLNQLKYSINKTKEPKTTILQSTIEINIKTEYDPNRKIKNIIGIIPGRGKNKNEIIMFGAHYDHLGLTPNKEVFHGADDNASGTAVCLEVARLLRKTKPKKTIMVAFWGAEEQGLYGSKNFITNPYLDLKNIIGYFNLDMVGQGDGKVNLMGTYYSEKIFEILNRDLKPEIKRLIIPKRGGPGGSDQTYFLLYGIPSFFIYTKGYHYNYHTIWDLPENINVNALRNTALVLYESLLKISKLKYSLKENNRIEKFVLKYSDLVISEPIEIDNLNSNLILSEFPLPDLILTYSSFENYISLRDNLIYEVNRVNNYFNKELIIKYAENYTKLKKNIYESITSIYWGIRFYPYFLETRELPLFLKKIGTKFVYFKLNTIKVNKRLADFIDELYEQNIVSILLNGSKLKLNYLLNETKSKGKSMIIYDSTRIQLKQLLSWLKDYDFLLLTSPDINSIKEIKPYLFNEKFKKRIGLNLNIRLKPELLYKVFTLFEYNKQNREKLKGLFGNNLIDFFKKVNKDTYTPMRPF